MTQTRPWFRKEPGGASERWQSVFSFFLQGEGFAPAGATKGLSDRPLETFGPMLVGMLARQETVSFLLGVFA